MKKSINTLVVLIVLLLIVPTMSIAQAKLKSSTKYTTSVTLLNRGKIKGYLKEVTNDSIQVMSKIITPYISKIAYKDIHEIEIESHNSTHNVLKGIMIGGLSGFAVGSLMGYLGGDDPPCDKYCGRLTASEKASLGGKLGTAPGMILGGIIGWASNYSTVKIPINGRKKFDRNKLTKYQLVF